MNNTKWGEIWKAFYYGIERSDDPELSHMAVHWCTKSVTGFLYSDSTWTHFAADPADYKEIEWLRIVLTPQNREIVLDILRRIHVPGEVLDNCVYIYGYRTDVDYIT